MERFFLLFLFCQGCHPFSCATVFLQCLFECLQISSDINNHSERVIFSVWYNATMWRMPFVSLIVRASKFHVWVLLFFSLPWFGWKRLLLFEVPIFHFQSWNLMSFFCHETPIKEAILIFLNESCPMFIICFLFLLFSLCAAIALKYGDWVHQIR